MGPRRDGPWLGRMRPPRRRGLHRADAHLAVAGDRLVLTLKGAHVHPRRGELLPFPMDARIDGRLTAGVTFTGDDILRVSLGADMTIEMSTWVVVDGDEPSLWIGRFDTSLSVDFGGNLIVERLRPDGLRFGRACHFRLSGSYTYYLIQSGGRTESVWHLVVDTGGGIPDKEALEYDFLLLQFVLGRQLRIPTFLGVTSDGRTVAATTGAGTRGNLQPKSVAPVPINRNNDDYVDESWASLLFERVSVTWSARPKARAAFAMAFDSYLDAMTHYLDADCLRLHVGLEAFSYWTLRLANETERMVVKDKAAWKEWVKANSAAIRALAAEGFEESLFNKVIGVYRLSSGRVVPSAFLLHDLPLTAEMNEELERRDTIVHQGMMSPEGYDGDRDSRSINLVRTLLVALIAKTAGYGGAINGWELGSAGYRLEPTEWWSVRETDRLLARQTYIAEAALRPAPAVSS